MYELIHLDWLPKVPEHLLGYTLEWEDRVMLANLPRNLKRDGVEFPEGIFRKQHVNPEIKPWITENIVTDWKEMGYMRMTGTLGPHLDRTRFYVLTYVIKEGGAGVETVFYEPKSNSLDIGMMDSRVDDYDQLQATNRYRMREGNWYLLYGRGDLHSVEGADNDIRITLQISFVRDPIKDGIIKHSSSLTAQEQLECAKLPMI
jgi:hypothetical protein